MKYLRCHVFASLLLNMPLPQRKYERQTFTQTDEQESREGRTGWPDRQANRQKHITIFWAVFWEQIKPKK